MVSITVNVCSVLEKTATDNTTWDTIRKVMLFSRSCEKTRFSPLPLSFQEESNCHHNIPRKVDVLIISMGNSNICSKLRGCSNRILPAYMHVGGGKSQIQNGFLHGNVILESRDAQSRTAWKGYLDAKDRLHGLNRIWWKGIAEDEAKETEGKMKT